MNTERGRLCETIYTAKRTVCSENVDNTDNLTSDGTLSVSFAPLFSDYPVKFTEFRGNGSYVVLDFGRELAGGIRIITSSNPGKALLHITFGESLTEAMSKLGEKGSCNDHSPRDITVTVPFMSDLTFGQTAFRFVKIEIVGDSAVKIQRICAVERTTEFPRKGFIKTNDRELNRILETAARTLHLCCQNGYIWDGVKRDRLVWSGDLHQEILTAMYLFGDVENIPNSLTFLKNDTKKGSWINSMSAYSAWWVISLCDYRRLSGNIEFWDDNVEYAREILHRFNNCISPDGDMHGIGFFLDWPCNGKPDAVLGTAAIILTAARRFSEIEQNGDAAEITDKLRKYLSAKAESKQALALQLFAGKDTANTKEKLGKGGARGLSTFMCYYILSAYAEAGGDNSLDIIKEYFGAMLSRGATSFWEDFDLDWLEDSGRIDELPTEGQRDIHGDYGAFCYKGFRHSLCHAWSAGVYAFFVEHILGVQLKMGCPYKFEPNVPDGLTVEAEIPIKDGMLCLSVKDGSFEHFIRK